MASTPKLLRFISVLRDKMSARRGCVVQTAQNKRTLYGQLRKRALGACTSFRTLYFSVKDEVGEHERVKPRT